MLNMAEKIIKQLVDDIDGSEATETINFTYRNVDYRLDLSEKNAQKLDAALQKWIEPAQTIGRRRRMPQPTGTRELTSQIRAWAISKGYGVSEKGRIAQSVIDDYHAAHK